MARLSYACCACVVIILLVGIASCRSQASNTSLPTIAVLPSQEPTSIPTSQPTVSPSIVPTFTLAPKLLAIEIELTTAFSNSDLMQDIIRSHSRSGESQVIVDRAVIEKELETFAYMKVGFDIIKREMAITDAVGRVLGGAGNKHSFYFQYEYQSDNLSFQQIDERVPYMLCSLREAGLDRQYIEFTVDLNKNNGDFGGASYFCISPDVIISLNCTDPKRTVVQRIQTSKDCLEQSMR